MLGEQIGAERLIRQGEIGVEDGHGMPCPYEKYAGRVSLIIHNGGRPWDRRAWRGGLG
jgi:hypothetical protein